jgi:hypothetical protein
MININSIVIKQIDSFRHCSEILHDKQSFDHTFRRHCLKLCPSHLICFPLYFESCALSCATLSHPLSRTQNTKQMYMYLVPRTSYLIPRVSYLVPRTSHLIPRTTYLVHNSRLTKGISQRYGSADPDPDPYQNFLEAQNCLPGCEKCRFGARLTCIAGSLISALAIFLSSYSTGLTTLMIRYKTS